MAGHPPERAPARRSPRPDTRPVGAAGILAEIVKKSIVAYGLAVAALVFALEWLEYRYAVRLLPLEAYVAVVALAFTALGVWVGRRLTTRPAAPPFEKNVRALAHLGITDREYEVLGLLALGRSNKEIADALFVSQNTVKTHVARLYDKLDVSRRTEAVHRAKQLRLLP
jgi:DNA-binding CsgD family transcriptional regulator